MESLKNLKVGVIGLAKSGLAAANFARSSGASVFVTESKQRAECAVFLKRLAKGVTAEFGAHSDRILESDIIVRSPGVPNNLRVLVQAKRSGIPVYSEIEFASRYISPREIIAITGTNGKTTTTSLVSDIFKTAGRKTVTAGNIGSPLADCVKKITPRTSVVLEVSSYQLEDVERFRPTISAILNITPDHIEHHKTMRGYIDAKARVFENQKKTDFCVLNYDDKKVRALKSLCGAKVIFFSAQRRLASGVFYSNGSIVVKLPFAGYSIALKLKIPGRHNIENALAAAAIAAAAGIKRGAIEKAINGFRGVEHRIEFTAAINGVEYINDSKATNVDSTLVALKAFEKPVWLILGGRDKGAPYRPLGSQIKKKVKAILLIGEAAAKIRKEFSGTAELLDAGDIDGALSLASRRAVKGDIVLLSPACASFDQFDNYEHRGRYFKNAVLKMKKRFEKK
ncbi:MAG: UDP-N-acetylmuramoylalanine--D-glutamate ligase [Elusimicrobia bacterium RIFOXYA1_FULL_47_7]|nr:MAG: UDP-N-acetylmuramoylalanine--D-glutamate ligase [Elusimicrobia bacterium RIFOXYA12_FULL_49_49]OGS09986.1 MAG: UDP-N-acetylmuramoylalanine--D-glutamate ligase [Elusimicrobia bacterium RIFOXYA1_FULL_47_7]OGS15662.1 MAG: UDP-N-acetylmuramoylalanine--D-glutamate ligase [Elusimicrobia bacterium RIFOXYA2_FULL_47_53]OGS26914.1 MAG: UDP-N-acetylmuramoylalanine--D-glutamate ligase [Elusimicrobia bacterium RIFOXYB12_FULL_50_12]OGS30761.1 MAG: UDP-N-acetylmuramoylalanine--D-glutamate ligase [Elusi